MAVGIFKHQNYLVAKDIDIDVEHDREGRINGCFIAGAHVIMTYKSIIVIENINKALLK